jgi:hypothetical protein
MKTERPGPRQRCEPSRSGRLSSLGMFRCLRSDQQPYFVDFGVARRYDGHEWRNDAVSRPCLRAHAGLKIGSNTLRFTETHKLRVEHAAVFGQIAPAGGVGPSL